MRRAIHCAIASLAFLAGQAFITDEAVAADAENADVYIVHGISGTDLGQSEETLTVDYSIDGECSPNAASFKNVIGPVPVPVGTHQIKLFLADGACTGTLLIARTLAFSAFETSTLVAHLDQNAVISLEKYTNNVAPLEDSKTRMAVVHAADAPPVDVVIVQAIGEFDLVIRNLGNKEQSFAPDIGVQNYIVRVSAAASGDELNRPILARIVTLSEFDATTAYLVGTLDPADRLNDTLDLIEQVIDLRPDDTEN